MTNTGRVQKIGEWLTGVVPILAQGLADRLDNKELGCKAYMVKDVIRVDIQKGEDA